MELQNILNDFDNEFGLNSTDIERNDYEKSGKSNKGISHLSEPKYSEQSSHSLSSFHKDHSKDHNILTNSKNENQNESFQTSTFSSNQKSQMKEQSSDKNISDNQKIHQGFSFGSSMLDESQLNSTMNQTSGSSASQNQISAILHEISVLHKNRIEDIENLQKLRTENAQLNARLTILEHMDIKVAELGSKVEQLLQKYLDTEMARSQQADEITTLRQKVIILRQRAFLKAQK